MKTTHILVLLLAHLFAAIPGLAGSPDVVVLRLDDAPGTRTAGVSCTLRQAVAYLDSLNLSRPGIISLQSGTYFLSIPDVPGTAGVNLGSIKINTDIEIRGDDSAVSIDAQGLSRHFDVGTGRTLTLNNLTLQKGRPADRAPGADGTPGDSGDSSTADGGNGATGLLGKNGGSIHVGESARLFCTEVTFLDNQAGRGSDGGAGGQGASNLVAGFGSFGDGGTGGSGSRGGSGGAVHGDVSSEITLDCCTFIRNAGGAGGSGGEGGRGGSGQFSGGSGGVGGAAGSGGRAAEMPAEVAASHLAFWMWANNTCKNARSNLAGQLVAGTEGTAGVAAWEVLEGAAEPPVEMQAATDRAVSSTPS